MCASNRASDSNRLKDAIRDEDLRRRAENVWRTAEHLLRNATEPGGSESGYDHATNVDNNIGRFLHDTRHLNDLGEHGKFLLTCAAAYHDVAKGIGKDSWSSEDHGEASGRYIFDKHDQLHLRTGEARFLQLIVSVHNRKRDRLGRELANLSEPCTTEEGEKDPRLFATLLKLGDLLQADSRIDTRTTDLADQATAAKEAEQAWADAPQDEQLANEAERRGHGSDIASFRSHVKGWRLEGAGTIVLEYVVRLEDDAAHLKQSADILREDEFEPLRRHLTSYGYPDTLEFKADNVPPRLSQQPSDPFTAEQRAIGCALASACSDEVAECFYAGVEVRKYKPFKGKRELIALIIRSTWDEVTQAVANGRISAAGKSIVVHLPESDDQEDLRNAWHRLEKQLLDFIEAQRDISADRPEGG